MKLSKKWLMVIALVMSLTMATAGTLAYLTDRDTVENTFTVGNVDIEVEEEFEQDSPLNPGVKVDKQAGIENVHATEPAYVWMVVSVPTELAQYIELGWADSYSATEIASPHDGYTGYLVKYPSALAAGGSTGNILESVELTANVDYQNGKYVVVEGGEIKAEIGELSNVSIMVDGFAIQTEGFADVNEDGKVDVEDAYLSYTAQWKGLNGGESVDTRNINEDITEDISIPEDKAVAMNLGDDVTLTGIVENAGDLTISGGTVAGDYVENTSEMEITGTTLNTGTTGDYAMISKGTDAETTLNDVQITSGGGGVAAADGAKVEFNSGKIYVDTASTSGRYIFYAEGEGTVITINDGEFSWDPKDNQKRAYIYAGAGTTVYVNGGTFGKASTRSGYTDGILGSGTVIITGGTFGFDPSKWVADGYEAVKTDTTWTVRAK